MNGGVRNAKGFTIREQLLIADYLRTLGANATESAKRAGYSGNRNTLGVTAFETLRRPKIAREIKRRMSRKMSTEQIESEIAEVAVTDCAIDATAKMKALDLLTKINGMIVQKVETTDTTERDSIAKSILISVEKAATRDNLSVTVAATELYDALHDLPGWGDVSNWGEHRAVIEAHIAARSTLDVEPLDGGTV